MKLLLIGGNGQVGYALTHALAGFGDLTVTTRNGRTADGATCDALDVSVLESIGPYIESLRPDVVINATAYTAVDRAEDEPALAFAINADAPARTAAACAKIGARFVHYSTDYVFDGKSARPYREDDPTAPLGVYGASKLAGERAVLDIGADSMVLRTSWVYGAHGANFAKTMLRLAGERDELRVVGDQFGAPTSADLIARVTRELLAADARMPPLMHLTAGGVTSWHGFASALIEHAHGLGLIKRCPVVIPITTAEFPTKARRPAYSVLDTALLREAVQIQLPDWQQEMHKVLGGMPALH